MIDQQVTNNPLRTGLKDHFTDRQRRRLEAACVGIAGAGGLGSNVAVHLVRSGIGRLVVVDFDRVAPSNLNRQFYFTDQVGMPKVQALAINLKRINPGLVIQPLDIRLDASIVAGVFESCQVIVEALDEVRTKTMMADAFLTDTRLLVCASGIGGWGDSDRIRTRRLGESFVLVGDETSEVCTDRPPTSAIVGLAAAKQADAVIEALMGRASTAKEGKREGNFSFGSRCPKIIEP